jgi:RNA polymerase-binding transcription factor DksA
MAKKGLTVWLFSSLTFISLTHLIEAVSTLIFNNPIRLLQLYPFINERVSQITPLAYFVATAVLTIVLWGITCAIAFDNPVEAFLNKILTDAQKQSATENQLIEDKSSVLDAMYETIESDNQILAQVKDLMCNIRADAKEIHPLKENMEKMKAELASLKKEIKKIEEIQFPNICTACGKPLLPEFKICPYCGQTVTALQTAPMISLKNYK